MSQMYEMCQAIVNFSKNEMTADNVIESMNGAGVNPHSIRCAFSRIASKGILVEPTSKHQGRAKLYRKRDDINDQWDWMMAHRSPKNRLVLPNPETIVNFQKQSTREPMAKRISQNPAGSRQTEVVAGERILKELAKINKTLGAIQNAIRENAKALQELENGKPTVVIRKQKA